MIIKNAEFVRLCSLGIFFWKSQATHCEIFLAFYPMICYSEPNLYVSLFYIQIFSPSKATIHFIFNLCRILCMFQL